MKNQVDLVQDRNYWRALDNAALNPGFHKPWSQYIYMISTCAYYQWFYSPEFLLVFPSISLLLSRPPVSADQLPQVIQHTIDPPQTGSFLSLAALITVSSNIRLRPLGLFLPPGIHLPISFVVFLYFFSLQVCNLKLGQSVVIHSFYMFPPIYFILH